MKIRKISLFPSHSFNLTPSHILTNVLTSFASTVLFPQFDLSEIGMSQWHQFVSWRRFSYGFILSIYIYFNHFTPICVYIHLNVSTSHSLFMPQKINKIKSHPSLLPILNEYFIAIETDRRVMITYKLEVRDQEFLRFSFNIFI